MDAKAKSRLLPTKVAVMMLTADGRHREIAIPLRPLNSMSSAAFRDRPHPRVKPDCKTQPTRYMKRAPNESAIDPDNSSVQPHVKAWIEDGLVRSSSVRNELSRHLGST